jgi:2-phospho-L-lactate guanylyltransferase
MNVRAIVPVKALQLGKSRLIPALSPRDRAELVERMLQGELAALGASAVEATAVISPDAQVWALAVAGGAQPLPDPGGGLNAALEAGRAWALAGGADALLVILGDLPLLRESDIAGLIAELEYLPAGQPAVVLAPDRYDGGTNAMLLRPPGVLPFQFGTDSYPRHRQLATDRGLAVAVYRTPGLAFDLDTPGDLADWPAPARRH